MDSSVGSIVYHAKIESKDFNRQARGVENTVQDLGGETEKSAGKMNTALVGVGKVGFAALAAAAVTAAAVVTANIGKAVKRVDTLNNFPRIMTNLGYSTEESSDALTKLDKGVRGLPTSLDNIASAMQNIAPASKSLEEATDLTLALNNALIAGGKDAAVQASAFEQFSQAIAKGRPDMMEWRSIASAMPGQLGQISENLGFENWQKMAEAVSNGELEFDKVKETIIQLNEKGLGSLPSFAKQARNATDGMATGMANAQTSIVRGVGNIITAIGSSNISNAISGIGSAFEKGLSVVAGAITWVIDEFTKFWELIKPIREFIADQFMSAFDNLKQAFDNIKTSLEEAGVDMELVGKIIGIIAAGPLILLVGAITAVVVIISTLVNWISIAIRWLTNLPKEAAHAFVNVQNIFSKIGEFFRNSAINIGTAIGDAFKGAVNGVLRFVANTINGLIDGINGAIDLINNIPGVDLGKIGRLPIPQLAEGGIVTGPTLAMIGEGREAEAVIPLSKLDQMIDGNGSKNEYNIGVINIDSEVDGERWLKKLTQNQEITNFGLTPNKRYA